MKQVTINLYKINELSEEAKQKAYENLWDINVSFGWWDFIYEDAENIGIKIAGFDIDRGNYCRMNFTNSTEEAAQKIISEHGEDCETYKIARKFLKNRDNLVEKYSDGVNKTEVAEEKEYDFDNECDYLEQEFLRELSEAYLIILRNEYEYLSSKEMIIETIKANDYDFTEDGNIY